MATVGGTTPAPGSGGSSQSLSAQSTSALNTPKVTNIRHADSFGTYLGTIVLDQQPAEIPSYDIVSGGKRRYKVTYGVGGTNIRRDVILEEMSTYDFDFGYASSQRSYVWVKCAGANEESNTSYWYFDGYLPSRYAMYFNGCEGAVVTDVVVEGNTGGIMALDSTLFVRDSEISLAEGYEAFIYEIDSTVEESNVTKTVRT